LGIAYNRSLPFLRLLSFYLEAIESNDAPKGCAPAPKFQWFTPAVLNGADLDGTRGGFGILNFVYTKVGSRGSTS
jgi:hypothetical protein